MQWEVDTNRSQCCASLNEKKPCREKEPHCHNTALWIGILWFLHLNKCKGGYEYRLVIVDHHTRFAEAVAVADKIFNDYILKIGFPQHLHHDREDSGKTSCLNSYRTVGYWAQELRHITQTVMGRLSVSIGHYYKCWKHSLRGKSLTGKSCWISSCLHTKAHELTLQASLTFISYLEDHQACLLTCCSTWLLRQGLMTTKNTWKNKWKCHIRSQQRRQRKVQRGTSNTMITKWGVGQVLVWNMTPRWGTEKLRNHWEDCIYKVIRPVGKDVLIYEVMPEQGKGRGSRILYHNLMLPFDHLRPRDHA